MKKNKSLSIMIIGILMILLAIAGATYAYFTATITNGDKGSSVIIKTGTLRLVYSDTEYINVSGVLPGSDYTKTVTVTNEGNVPVYYDLVWIELLNQLTTKNDLTMEISCSSNTDTCDGLSNTVVSDSGSNIPILYNIEIGMLETHTYTITLHFNETGSNQNDNQGKIISGKIGIIEARDLAVNLYGYVYDENSSVMPNVVVELHSDPVSVVTDANGRYEFESIPLGTHTAYIKTSDGTSTITTTSLSLKQGKTTNINDTNVTLSASRQSIGINISINVIDPILSLTQPSGTLKGVVGDPNYSGEYYAYRSSITSISIDNKISIPGDAVSSWDVSSNTNGSVMAYIKSDGVSGYDLHIQAKDGMYAPINSEWLFYGFEKTLTIKNLENLNTSKVKWMGYMFAVYYYNFSQLTTLDVSSFDTTNVEEMSWMFAGCQSLLEVDVSNFDTSKVQYMAGMFGNCKSLESLDLSNFDTSNVISINNMFADCSSIINLDLSNFDTSKVTDMGQMFYQCFKLETLNLSNFNTSNVTYMGDMFVNCWKLTNLNLSSFDTSNVTDMTQMFSGCSTLTSLNLSNFDTSNVTSITGTFGGLTHLNILNISNFDISNITNYDYTFQNISDELTIIVRDASTQNFINARLLDVGKSATVIIG